MKKLIEELEAGKKFTDEIFNDTPIGKALKEGYEAAYKIVRAHNPWHEVTELPPRDEKTDNCSINVWVTDGQRRNIGFYDFAEGVWIMGKAYARVTHWAYLPEAKP